MNCAADELKIANARVTADESLGLHGIVDVRNCGIELFKNGQTFAVIFHFHRFEEQENSRILLHQAAFCFQNLALQLPEVDAGLTDCAAKLENDIAGDIAVKKAVIAGLAAEVVEQKSLADLCFLHNFIRAGMVIPVQRENAKACIDHAVLFFLFQIVEFLVHAASDASSVKSPGRVPGIH